MAGNNCVIAVSGPKNRQRGLHCCVSFLVILAPITLAPKSQYADEARDIGTVAAEGSSDEDDASVAAPAESSPTVTAIAGDSVRDSLQQEIAELKREKSKGAKARMATVETGCKGTCGISIPRNGPLSPVETCLRMLEEAKAGHSSTRCVSIYPFQAMVMHVFASFCPTPSYHYTTQPQRHCQAYAVGADQLRWRLGSNQGTSAKFAA